VAVHVCCLPSLPMPPTAPLSPLPPDAAALSRSSTFYLAAILPAKCASCACHTTRLTFSQVCASGALLNCIGPSLSPVFEHPRRRALRKVELGGLGGGDVGTCLTAAAGHHAERGAGHDVSRCLHPRNGVKLLVVEHGQHQKGYYFVVA